MTIQSEISGCDAGYFKGAGAAQWQGSKDLSLAVESDFGPQVMDEQLGICTVGAVPLVTNYNILTTGLDITACVLLMSLFPLSVLLYVAPEHQVLRHSVHASIVCLAEESQPKMQRPMYEFHMYDVYQYT